MTTAPKAKNLAIAYFLFGIFGLQGVHQFYLGNYTRGLAIALSFHLPIFAFAYMMEKAGGDPNLVGPMFGILPMLAVLAGLVVGFALFFSDLFTLKRQLEKQKSLAPPKL